VCVCVCVYVCVRVYVYIFLCIHTYPHIHTHTDGGSLPSRNGTDVFERGGGKLCFVYVYERGGGTEVAGRGEEEERRRGVKGSGEGRIGVVFCMYVCMYVTRMVFSIPFL